VAALNDTQPDVQVSAAKALGQIKDQRAFDPLLAAFHGGRTNYEVENAEAEALGGLGTAALDPLLADLKDKDLGSAAGNGLVQLGAPAVDSLIALLKDRNPDIRAQVAECLGEIKDGRADQPLIAALKDKDERVPQAAAKALGEIGDPEAANFLFAALHKHNTEIVAAARDFFIKRGEPGTEDALIDALDKSGDEGMAAEFLNSGNQKLADAAHAWAGRNNYEITYMPGSGSTGWGSK
jgi:HEAT repeat protein